MLQGMELPIRRRAVHALAIQSVRFFRVRTVLIERACTDAVLRFNCPRPKALYAKLAPMSTPRTEGLSTSERRGYSSIDDCAICRD